MPSLRSAVSHPTLIVRDLNRVWARRVLRGRTSGAVRPRSRTAFAVELQRDPVLGRLRRRRGVAGTAGGLPRGLVELELPAVAAAARDRARVAAGLALRDLLEDGRQVHVRAAGRGARAAGAAGAARGSRAARRVAGLGDADAECTQRGGAGDAVGLEALALLEALHGATRLVAVVAAHRAHVEL